MYCYPFIVAQEIASFSRMVDYTVYSSVGDEEDWVGGVDDRAVQRSPYNIYLCSHLCTKYIVIIRMNDMLRSLS